MFGAMTRDDDYDEKSSRFLESNDNNYQSYLVDSEGEEYEPYSLAWRYLGMYIDCDVEDYAQQGDNEDGDDEEWEEDDNRRDLGSGDGGDDTCQRKVLWAAYVDPRYRGGEIGEYQFYDWEYDTWDTSTCKTRRCARMNCHEPRTHFNLIGVFKETDGLYDWAEQLFKHQGYCVWKDDDVYDFMDGKLEGWPTNCNQLYLPDEDGNDLYLDTKPLPYGDMTYGIYTDEYCTQESTTTSFFDYVVMYYYNYYGDQESGYEYAAQWNYTFQDWNHHMNSYKVCQPCRAYDLVGYSSSDDDGSGDRRFLENDGEGDNEQWGYDCYDDAGYLNCNQCFKFESKTDMEPASTEDLQRASKQGTILRIKVNGKVYGSGGFHSSAGSAVLDGIIILLGSLLAGGFLFLLFADHLKLRSKIVMFFHTVIMRRKLHRFPPRLKESLHASNKPRKRMKVRALLRGFVSFYLRLREWVQARMILLNPRGRAAPASEKRLHEKTHQEFGTAAATSGPHHMDPSSRAEREGSGSDDAAAAEKDTKAIEGGAEGIACGRDAQVPIHHITESEPSHESLSGTETKTQESGGSSSADDSQVRDPLSISSGRRHERRRGLDTAEEDDDDLPIHNGDAALT